MLVWEYFKNGACRPTTGRQDPSVKFFLQISPWRREVRKEGPVAPPPPGDGPLLSATSCLPWATGISSDCKL